MHQHLLLLRDLGVTLSEGQDIALKQLGRIANIEGSALRIDNVVKAKSKNEHSTLCVDISFSCLHYEKSEGGLDLHSRESVRLYIHVDFPYQVPSVTTAHSRFSGFNHVQWGVQLCLYQSEDSQWQPSQGMFGLIRQLDNWFEKAAINQLDHPEGPIHPPVAYPVSDTTVCIRKDTPSRDYWPWFGAAIINERKPGYYELEGWDDIVSLDINTQFAPALLLDFELPFEYPKTIWWLFKCIETKGVDTSHILVHLMIAAQRLAQDMPLYFVIGAPSRGVAGEQEARHQHLQIWEIEPVDVQKLKNVSLACDVLNSYKGDEAPEEIKRIIENVFDSLFEWQKQSNVRWCSVMEDRPEIVTPRDKGTDIDWFKNKSVALWGCGALGGVIAEHLVRAGVKKLILYDNKKVSPGILVRQNFIESDINDIKTVALEKRLKEINSKVEIITCPENIIKVLDDNKWCDEIELVIDATASLLVRSKLERSIKSFKPTVPIGSVMISGAARYGVATLAPQSYSGGTLDVLRRLGISVMKRSWLEKWKNAFWDETTDENTRQPEPGCSDPTFIGSHADVAGLAARMINCLASELVSVNDQATGCLLSKNALEQKDHIFKYDSDIVVNGGELEFRFSMDAWRDTQGWINTGSRIRTAQDETGGLLFGHFDEILGIGWITNVSGPPGQSEFSPEGFICGTEGTQKLCKQYGAETNGLVQYVGTWHSHPVSKASPSEIDLNGIAEIFATSEGRGSHQLMMIIGFSSQYKKEVGVYAFEKEEYKIYANSISLDLSLKGGRSELPDVPAYGISIGLALSGGGSRAVAFHLGTLRALEDLGLLDEVSIISGVSGGSVMAAILGYSDKTFIEIDEHAVSFLKQGLVWPAIRKLLHPWRFFKILIVLLLVTIPSVLFDFIKNIVRKCASIFSGNYIINNVLNSLNWPIRRWYSRTHVMADTIEEVVGAHMCDDNTRRNMSVVFNACELRTGTAFRMSNEYFGSWRYGYASSSELRLADAVTASAAYPALLPAFDWCREFSKGRVKSKERVIVTDGGVYENLGVSVLEPGRDPKFSAISYNPQIIVASDAGAGQLKGDSIPARWSSRMVQVINSVMRKVQDATKGRLYKYTENGELDRFVYVQLGQIDSKVALKSPDWIEREAVMNYPTDFSKMTDDNIRLLSGRGETITRTLVTQYLLSD